MNDSVMAMPNFKEIRDAKCNLTCLRLHTFYICKLKIYKPVLDFYFKKKKYKEFLRMKSRESKVATICEISLPRAGCLCIESVLRLLSFNSHV